MPENKNETANTENESVSEIESSPVPQATPAPESESKDPSHERLHYINALLIATVTVFAALVAWRASVAGSFTGDYDYDGLKAVVAREEVVTLATIEATAHAQAYANFRRFDTARVPLDFRLDGATKKEAAEIERKRSEVTALAEMYLLLFPNKFIDYPGNTYKTKSEISQFVANEKRTRDLAWEDDFQSAEAYRTKTRNLLRGVAILTLAMVCFTLVEALEGAAAKATFVGGVILSLVGVAYSISMELAKYV